ncbi:Signal peptidase I [Candidatus Syntrophocurvum alkaliphilum]|uniref:Signal peptidase I n=1 Tax=Candidatus Syntrophocurvum alkaliphilum TaxID=2293317 RepID=A0A6I6D8D5_9FIRM|nr:signal peptidase I [Candidatus Syntrophocurvum alkaliphilum]QGT99278.1 Signal peptidase I [Candidatus Syntrophocurvum alkaliphilum]
MSRETKDFIKELLSIIIIAFILAMVLRTFVVEGRIIPSGSMLPTLQINDRVMVNKFIYNFKDIERGELIVFTPPDGISNEQDYIKRVIGLEGETVEIKNGKTYIDNQKLIEPYLLEPIDYEYGPVVVPENSLFVLGDNRNHSYDSHMWNVWLTEDRVKGKAFLIYWPLTNITIFEQEVSIEK